VAAPASASPELFDRPRWRSFTAQDKLRILAETDRATETGGIGAILRREGLYSSALTDWRRQRDAGAFSALAPGKRGPKPAEPNPLTAEMALLQRDNARLTRRLARAEAIIDTKKKLRRYWAFCWRRAATSLDRGGRGTCPASGMTKAACVALDVSRASVQPRRTRLTASPPIPRPRPKPARALSVPQQQVVLDLLHELRFADQTPPEIDATLLDEGVYHGSIRTMYRILDQHDEVGERREQLRHPAYRKPGLLADRPDEV
jgi:transposase-like protein